MGGGRRSHVAGRPLRDVSEDCGVVGVVIVEPAQRPADVDEGLKGGVVFVVVEVRRDFDTQRRKGGDEGERSIMEMDLVIWDSWGRVN